MRKGGAGRSYVDLSGQARLKNSTNDMKHTSKYVVLECVPTANKLHTRVVTRHVDHANAEKSKRRYEAHSVNTAFYLVRSAHSPLCWPLGEIVILDRRWLPDTCKEETHTTPPQGWPDGPRKPRGWLPG